MEKKFNKIKVFFKFLSVALLALPTVVFQPAYADVILNDNIEDEDYVVGVMEEEETGVETVKTDEVSDVAVRKDKEETKAEEKKEEKKNKDDKDDKDDKDNKDNKDEVVSVKATRETSGEAGQIIIPFTMSWDDEEEFRYRPDSVTISLYKYVGDNFDKNTANVVKTVSVTAELGWAYDFDISNESLQDDSGSNYKFKVLEDEIDLYDETEHVDPVVGFVAPPATTDGEWKKYTRCDSLSISSENDSYSIAASKKGNKMTIWSELALAPAEREVVKRSLERKGENLENAVYISGLGEFSEDGITVADGEIRYGDKSKWSYVYFGTYVPASSNITPAKITNKHEFEYIDLSFSKVWDDEDDKDGLRVGVKVDLLADGEKVEEKDITTENADYTFNRLPKCSDYIKVSGEMVCAEIGYTLSEEEIDGYTATIEGDIENGFIITNKHAPEVIEEGYGSSDEGDNPEEISVISSGLLAPVKMPETGVGTNAVEGGASANLSTAVVTAIAAVTMAGAALFAKRK